MAEDLRMALLELLHRADLELEYIRFAVNEAREREAVERVLQQLESVLANHGAV